MKCVLGVCVVVVLCLAGAADAIVDIPGDGGLTFPQPRPTKCPPGQSVIACTASIPPNCLCGPTLPRSPRPDPGCVCPAVVATVCGVDGRSYGNSCTAGCLGVKVACEKKCPCAPTPPSPPTPPPPPPPTPPSSPTSIFTFDFAECQSAGDKASFAAARAACSTVKNKCPARPPSFALASSASGAAAFSADSRRFPEIVRRLIEKALAEVCQGVAERTCINNARSQVQDRDCEKVLSSGPAVSVSGCRSKSDANTIFQDKVKELCQAE